MAVGRDGIRFLTTIHLVPEYEWLQRLPARQVVRQVWFQQYYHDENGTLSWRTNKETPPAMIRIVSPYDIEARQGKKRETNWLGYKVHLTETCDPDAPKLITNVETRIACQKDALATDDIHQSLAVKNLLPEQHVVDTAYVSGPQLVRSQESYGIDLLGSVLPDTSWQAQRPDAYDLTRFQLN